MKFLSADDIRQHLAWQPLLNQLEIAFRDGVQAPPRHHHTIERETTNATMLLMPAWENNGYIGVKVLNVFPQNSERNLPAISGVYLLSDGNTGQPLACFAGDELTRRRTAAASALAAQYLARDDSDTLLIVGTGKVAPMLIEAYSAIRPIKRVLIWGRNKQKAQAIADQYANYSGPHSKITEITAIEDLESACQQADIVSCATLSSEAIIKGEWINAGTHVDLIGAFKKEMRETDAAVIAKSQVYVDTWAGAQGEAGDLHQAVAEGMFDMANIQGDLEQLTKGEVKGRQNRDAITLFKSVGASLEDLAAAIVVWECIS